MKQMRKAKKAKLNNLIKNQKLPILTLDSRWHEIFPEEEKTSEIKELEAKLNDLLGRQGKLVNEVKELKQLKKNLMGDIVANMEIDSSPAGKAKAKKQDRNKQYILEINEKIEKEMEELSKLPYRIREVNEELLVESVTICYSRIEKQVEEIKEVSDWIMKTREKLKEKILIKQDMESRNTTMYTYMHDLLGAELMESIDKKHFTE